MSSSPDSAAEQTHPLEASDRHLVDGLLAVTVPEDGHLVEAARLLMRYQGFPGASGLQQNLTKLLKLWGLSRDELNSRCRAIWASGYRPGQEVGTEPQAVGSGFDAADSENT